MRKKFVAGNWKMFTTASSATALARAVAQGVGSEDRVSVAVCPPFPYLERVRDALRGSNVALGAQNLYPEREGAFTGEVSPGMLADVGCKYVILGHSERRHKLGETDEFINRKVLAALQAGLQVILCVGETLAEREAGKMEEVVTTQLAGGLTQIGREMMSRLSIAYEPVWAIGTGRNATPEQAQLAHAFIRRQIADQISGEVAAALVIQYGGSVKADNATSLLSQPDVDGALVGGASLKADEFLAIVRAAIL
ncbi:MAG TPA: triose-phosphate isomerase [Gemmataceae bacterium]|nr:triose-phosphate isomerase [Gemmataceae bacterium]